MGKACCVQFQLSANSETYTPQREITFVCDELTISTEHIYGGYFPWLSKTIPKLKELNYMIEKVDWRNTNIDWKTKTNIIVGPIWNYVNHVTEFEEWIKNMLSLQETDKINVYNHMKFIQWNYDKSYLLDLQNIGNILIPDTLIIDDKQFLSQSNGKEKVFEMFDGGTGTGLVIKGLVDSAGQTFKRIKSKNELDENVIIDLLQSNKGVIIQPFYNEYINEGELCFCFYAGQLSHSFIRISAANSDNVNPESGTKWFYINTKHGVNRLYVKDIVANIATFRQDVDQNVIADNIINANKQIRNIYQNVLNVLQIKNVLDNDTKLLSIRVDGFMLNDEFVLCEVEGIEPYMAFLQSPDYVVDNYVEAIHNAVRYN